MLHSLRKSPSSLLTGLVCAALLGCGPAPGVVAQTQTQTPKVAKPAAEKKAETKPAEKQAEAEKSQEKEAELPRNPFQRRFDVPEFPKDMEWLNTKPLAKKDLRGKFVLLDFWTYCCINCMHILPELKKLEQQYPNELVVIGVHSAKFDGEKETENIRAAMLRHEIDHPVVNDAEHAIWNSLGVSSWPTILMLDPEGKAVWGRSGEFKAEQIGEILDLAIPYYRDAKILDETPFKLQPEVAKEKDTPLRYPGKVLADEASKRLFIADSNHNRIVIANLAGEVQEIIGTGEIGAQDGDYKTATFNHLQGMALKGETLYVADTENHMLRKIDLAAKKVTTIAGDGSQAASGFPGFDRFGGGIEENQKFVGKPSETALNSPWDLVIHKDVLYIAMAGPHQIWFMPLDESEIGPYAGNGREDIVDGPLMPSQPYALGASSFAQPSGLASDGVNLYVADSEGSSIRSVPFDPKKQVSTVVGTAELSAGRLFYFGDVDGERDQVKLQHCLGVAYHEGKIYVADTYNDKIKMVDAKTGATQTVVGANKPGLSDDPPQFDEPAGLSIAGGVIYVADTNNHAIRTVDLKTKKVGTLKLAGLQPPVKNETSAVTASKGPEIKVEAGKLKIADGKVRLAVDITLPKGWKANPLAKPKYTIESTAAKGVVAPEALGKKKLDASETTWTIELPVSGPGGDSLKIPVGFYYCERVNGGRCKFAEFTFIVSLEAAEEGRDAGELNYEIRE